MNARRVARPLKSVALLCTLVSGLLVLHSPALGGSMYIAQAEISAFTLSGLGMSTGTLPAGVFTLLPSTFSLTPPPVEFGTGSVSSQQTGIGPFTAGSADGPSFSFAQSIALKQNQLSFFNSNANAVNLGVDFDHLTGALASVTEAGDSALAHASLNVQFDGNTLISRDRSCSQTGSVGPPLFQECVNEPGREFASIFLPDVGFGLHTLLATTEADGFAIAGGPSIQCRNPPRSSCLVPRRRA
jgi:hypothetical protein